jgi:tetratricopeptide (TPR) repeat protein
LFFNQTKGPLRAALFVDGPSLSIIGFLTTLGLVWYGYHSGLTGTFLFDDFNNLSAIGAYGRIDSWKSLLLFVTSGEADLTGRPLSLLTFLIDADSWPASPGPFKHTNVLLHLLNYCLLAWLLLKLGRRVGLSEIHAQRAALLGSALWGLHPLLVSTTLYIVQREAMLAATFILAGFLLWESGQRHFLLGSRKGLLMMIAGAWGCTILATLCKGNGVLLPLLLVTLEFSLPPSQIHTPSNPLRSVKQVRLLLLGLPSALLVLWLLAGIPKDIATAFSGRPWTLTQRLMTETRVLTDYLILLWIPRASLSGLFYDDFPVSRTLLDPWTTLPAMLLIVALMTIGLALRRRAPQWSFALLFFLAGHLLESTVIPLELFFEHRNYLPALMMFWPIAIWLTRADGLAQFRAGLAILLPAILTTLTYLRAETWGAPYDQALLWAKISPHSPRAQINAADYERHHGRSDLAVIRLHQAITEHPDEVQLTFNLVDAECDLGNVRSETLRLVRESLMSPNVRGEFVYRWFLAEVPRAATGECYGFNLITLSELARSIQGNPKLSSGTNHEADLNQIEGRIALARGDGESALRSFNAALDLQPNPDIALTQAALLGASGFPKMGLKHIAHYKILNVRWPAADGMKAIHRWLLLKEGYWDKDMDHIEEQLRTDSAEQDKQSVLSQSILSH